MSDTICFFEESHGIYQAITVDSILDDLDLDTDSDFSDTQINQIALSIEEEHQIIINKVKEQNYAINIISNTYYLDNLNIKPFLEVKHINNYQLYTITHLYRTKKYKECLDSALDLIRKQASKVYSEVTETAARCCYHLKYYKQALLLMDFAVRKKELGYMVFVGELLRLNNQLYKALNMIQKYLEIRKDDSYAWSEVGSIMMDIFHENGLLMFAQSAERSMEFSRHLLVRHMPSGHLSTRMNEKRVKELDQVIKSLSRYKCDKPGNIERDKDVIWVYSSTSRMFLEYVEIVEVNKAEE